MVTFYYIFLFQINLLFLFSFSFIESILLFEFIPKIGLLLLSLKLDGLLQLKTKKNILILRRYIYPLIIFQIRNSNF